MSELTVVQRAEVALGTPEHEKALVALAAESVGIVAITNTAGYDECHAARMRLKNARLDVEKRAKAAREDAQAFSKAIIAQEKKLVGIVSPEEDRLAVIQKAYDDAKEAERQAKAKAEAERVNAIKYRIDEIRATVSIVAGSSASRIAEILGDLMEMNIDDSFAEFVQEAQAALETAIARVNKLLADAKEREAEQERIRLERIELARLRKAEEERQAQERAKFEAERAAARAEAEAKALAERTAHEKRVAAEQAALDAERKELEAQRRAMEAAKPTPISQMTNEQTHKHLDNIGMGKPHIKLATGEVTTRIQKPTDDMIIESLVLDFKVDRITVIGWLRQMDLELAYVRAA